MENDVLKGVVEVEKDINQRLEIERKKVERWLEKVKKEVESEVIAEESGLNVALTKTMDEALADAQSRATRIIDDAHQYAGKLEALSDDFLRKIILRHLTDILPGE